MNRSLRVCHIITGLSTGGAEHMLLRLLQARGAGDRDQVIALRSGGGIGDAIERLGVPVTRLDLGRAGISATAWPRARRAMQHADADLVLGWMYHGNLAAMLLAQRRPTVWGIRQSFGGYRRERLATRMAIWLGARWSDRAARIVYNSATSARQHAELGYAADRTLVIPNGFDTEHFCPDPDARKRLGHVLGIEPEAVIVGNASRFHPMKNHRGLLAAVERARALGARLVLVLAGPGVTAGNRTMAAWAEPLIRDGAIHLMGESDIARLAPGFDLYCSASAWGEGFPNAVGEAMACAVPCIVTAIGDSATLVADTGQSVEPQIEALAQALLHWATVPPVTRREHGAAARRRIIADFALPAIAARWYDVLSETAAEARHPPPRRGDHGP